MVKFTYYKITGIERKFFSLKDAKVFIWFNYSDENRGQLDGQSIVKYINGEPITETEIIVRGNKYAYSKPKRL